MVALSIGMPTYNDFAGVYMTIQALRLYQDLADTDVLVVDNYGCAETKQFVQWQARARYVLANEVVGTAAAKNRVFAEARGKVVLCCDSHVLFAPGTIARLRSYYRAHPGSRDLLQGPMLSEDFQTISTHQDPEWMGQKWGVWATDPRGLNPATAPFAIWGQGMGVFSCHRSAWLGFNPAFRGFGGEEGYIHEKFRQHGAQCLCLPWLRWVHQFGRGATPYPLLRSDLIKNYIIGHVELGLDLDPVVEHFVSEGTPKETVAALVDEAFATGQSPFLAISRPPTAPPPIPPLAVASPTSAPAPPQLPRPVKKRRSSGRRRA